MRGLKPVQPLSGIVTVWPEHQGPRNAAQVESARRCSDTRYAQAVAGRQRRSQSAEFAPYAISSNSHRDSASSSSSFKRKSGAPLDRLGSTGKPSASTRRRARKAPAFVGNMAYPASASARFKVVEKTSICPNECLDPAQSTLRDAKSSREWERGCLVAGIMLALAFGPMMAIGILMGWY